MTDKAGKLKTNLSVEVAYKSLTSSPLLPNPPVKLDNKIVELLSKVNKQLDLSKGIQKD